jgi:protocatechuate 3,4-dioxygenase beta subunit
MAKRQPASFPLTNPGITRRQWLGRAGIVATAITGLDISAIAQQLPPGAGMAAAPPCDPSTKPTPARTPAGFRPGAPQRSRLSDDSDKGQALIVTGSVIGLRCGLIAGAMIDVWPASSANASGMKYRGRQRTDAAGQYRFVTIVPRESTSGHAPHINMRVGVPGKLTFTTMAFLPDAVSASNATDRDYDPLLAMKLIDRSAAALTASFNVILDL